MSRSGVLLPSWAGTVGFECQMEEVKPLHELFDFVYTWIAFIAQAYFHECLSLLRRQENLNPVHELSRID